MRFLIESVNCMTWIWTLHRAHNKSKSPIEEDNIWAMQGHADVTGGNRRLDKPYLTGVIFYSNMAASKGFMCGRQISKIYLYSLVSGQRTSFNRKLNSSVVGRKYICVAGTLTFTDSLRQYSGLTKQSKYQHVNSDCFEYCKVVNLPRFQFSLLNRNAHAHSSVEGQGQDKNKQEKKKNSWFSPKNAWKLGLISLGGFSILFGSVLLLEWGAPLKDKEGIEIVDEFTGLPKWQQYPKRAWKEFSFFKQSIQDPSREKLLPDPLTEPYYQPPYTLVLEMNGVLVHPDWTLSTGWRFKKRPAIDYFLQQVAPPLFEVVIYTSEQGMTAWPLIDSLDPQGIIMYRLFRDATRYMDGHHVKDLDCLNRDLSKVIIVDCDPDSFKLHTRNAIGLQKWKGREDDRQLVDLAAFLRMIALSGVEDVRTVLDHYNKFDDPLEAFKENQRRLQVQQDQKASDKAQENQSLSKGWSGSFFGRRR